MGDREAAVTDNMEEVTAQYGEENYMRLISAMLCDINISLAKLVDGAETPSVEDTEPS